MRILYAGDSEAGGAANYLLAILHFLKADFIHAPPGKVLRPALFRRRFDAFLLSDFSKRDLPRLSENSLAEQVKQGSGLLMVGGWGSFSGPGGGWRGSRVEKLLPVSCEGEDDRVHLASGAHLVLKRGHPILQGSASEPLP